MSSKRTTKIEEPIPVGPDPSSDLSRIEPPAVVHLKQQVRAGRDWCEALLEAMGMWTLPQEEHQGRCYSYLLQGEAFDWLVLAERLCDELDGAVPKEEKEQLLFQGKLPRKVMAAEFKQLIGQAKHRAFLNYWYGVVVEEALQLKVEEEVRKQHRARGFADSEDLVEEVYLRLYEGTRTDLFKEFLKETGRHQRGSHSLGDIKEFTYWLFKRRVRIWDPARVASDTRKGLEKLHKLRHSDNFLGT